MLALADIAVSVSNARNAADWWKDTMGFAVHTLGQPGGHAVVVGAPGDRFLLHLCEGFEPVSPGNTGIGFITDDFDDQVRRMVETGVEFPELPSGGPGPQGAKFADPDGNVYWLMGLPTRFIREETGRRAPAAKPAPKRRALGANPRRRRG